MHDVGYFSTYYIIVIVVYRKQNQDNCWAKCPFPLLLRVGSFSMSFVFISCDLVDYIMLLFVLLAGAMSG